MSRGIPRLAAAHLTKAKEAAISAVEVYNRPGTRFRTPHYVVLIVIAWTALFHAMSYRRHRRPWYRKGTGRRAQYVRIEGEPKHWELVECLRQHFEDKNPPERKNLDFLIGLRNRIEHRQLPDLDPQVYGECQAALMNFEALLVSEFGPKHALSDSLAVSLQFSKVVPAEKATAARRVAAEEARDVLDYIQRFRGGLTASVLNSQEYSFSVYLVPKTVGRESSADMSVEFIRFDPQRPADMEKLAHVTAIIREKSVPIQNLDLRRPSEVIAAIRARLSWRFTEHSHAQAWRHFGVRPAGGSPEPQRTDSRYCVYDRAHRDYLFTAAWIERLATELADPHAFERITGKPPSPVQIAASAKGGGDDPPRAST